MDHIVEFEERVEALLNEREEFAKALSDSTSLFIDKVKQLSSMKRIIDTMRLIPDRKRVCEEILRALIDETTISGCSIWMTDETGGYVERIATIVQTDQEPRYFERGNPSTLRFSMGEGVVGWVAARGKLALISDVSKSKLLKISEITNSHPTGSLLCVPLKDKDVVIGVLSVSNCEKGMFNRDAKNIVELATGNVNLIFVNLRMFERIQQFNENLEQIVRDRTYELEEKNRILRLEISERKMAEKALKHHTDHDLLTGKANRLRFRDRLKHSIERIGREKGMLAVLLIDVDNFKRVNDSLGRQAGDTILKSVSDRLVDSLRSMDTVARHGGDEFTILLEDIEQGQEAVVVARKIIASLAKPFSFNGQDLYLTVSVGISFYPDDGCDCESIIKNADHAMYNAKENGKNNYQIFTQRMHDRAVRYLELETGIRKAISRNEMEAHFQPKIDLKSMRITGMEALIRWRRPSGKLAPPMEFIPVAEETGLIVHLDEWMLGAACSFANRMNSNGFKAYNRPVSVSVNLSAKDLDRPDIAKIIKNAVVVSGLSPSNLELEVTESSIIKNIDRAIKVLQELRDGGFDVSIDDFGTGYSSLNYLTKFPITTLKIDRSFVTDLPMDKNAQSIAKAIVFMAREMNVKVIAEGVENHEQLDLLREYGCDEVQGYLFSPPLAESEFLALRHREIKKGMI